MEFEQATFYFAYNPRTMRRLSTANGGTHFTTERAAKAAITREHNKGTILRENFKVGTLEQFEADDFEITVVSARDGKTECKIMKSEQGTSSDPSMERYWTL